MIVCVYIPSLLHCSHTCAIRHNYTHIHKFMFCFLITECERDVVQSVQIQVQITYRFLLKNKHRSLTVMSY